MNLQGVTVTNILDAKSAANTAAATSGWVDVRGFEGTVLVALAVGDVTGSITFTFHTADNSSGNDAVAIVPLEGAIPLEDSGEDVFVARFPATQLRGWLRVTGTIVTGPVLVQYSLIGLPKHAE